MSVLGKRPRAGRVADAPFVARRADDAALRRGAWDREVRFADVVIMAAGVVIALPVVLLVVMLAGVLLWPLMLLAPVILPTCTFRLPDEHEGLFEAPQATTPVGTISRGTRRFAHGGSDAHDGSFSPRDVQTRNAD